MIIGLMSDSHGSLKWFKRAYEFLMDKDLIIHAGDILYHGPRNPFPEDYNPRELSDFINTIPEGKILFVKGNCDSDVDQMVIKHDIKLRFKTVEFNPFIIGIIHGDQFKTDGEMFGFMNNFHLDILIHGHYHIKKAVEKEGRIIVSPGSLSLPKDGEKSVGILRIERFGLRVEFIDIEKGESIINKTFKIVK